MSRTYSRIPSSKARNRGAVLYVALIMLVLLALLGIVGMQVAGLQERMAANYLRANVAFQNAEARARTSEAAIESAVYSTGTFAADQEMCSPTFDPLTWADGLSGPTGDHVRRIDKCFPASSLRAGGLASEETGNIYEISALAGDTPTSPSATAVVNTIYIP
ncbi:MAG: protein PilX [Gammaproteobacteria bacterium]|nr:protein PilX [Gammaproteobacteria bacterium]